MKRLFFLFTLVISVLGFVFSSCEEKISDDDDVDNENVIPEKLRLGEIRIKAYPANNQKISFQILSKKFSVDWGDGTVEDFISDEEPVTVILPGTAGENEITIYGTLETASHEYANNNIQEIIILTEELIGIGKGSNMEMNGNYREIRFGKCPFLEAISFPDLGITVLEIESAESLQFLNCTNNNLSASRLNSLFESLPEIPFGWIMYDNNDGSETCDKSIAEDKGWYDEIQSQEVPLDLLATASYDSFVKFLRTHYQFECLYSNMINMEDFPALNYSGVYNDVYSHNISSNNNFVEQLFQESYRALRNINLSLTKFKEADGNLSLTIHSFSLLRAYAYFVMINYWGNIPVLEENIDINQALNPERAAVEQILSAITGDLLEAEKYLPSDEHNSDFGFSKSFAQLLLAKIYTYQGNYSKSLEYANKIINGGNFSLSSNPADAFENYMNKELITKFIDTYQVEGGNELLISMIAKGTYMPFARYPEVLLLASESYLKNNDMQSAANLLNILLRRNNRPEVSANNPVEIENAILNEYKDDLGKEGLYFFALKRFGKAESALGLESYEKLLPIPAREVDINPLIYQNEGY